MSDNTSRIATALRTLESTTIAGQDKIERDMRYTREVLRKDTAEIRRIRTQPPKTRPVGGR